MAKGVAEKSVNNASTDAPSAQPLEELAETLGSPPLSSLADHSADAGYTRKIDIAFSRQHQVLGLKSDGPLRVAICDWNGWDRLDTIGRILKRPTEPLLASSDAIQQAINTAYEKRSGQAQHLIDTLDEHLVLDDIAALADQEDLLDTSGRAPIVRLVNLILFEAVKSGASDVHIQPYEDRVIVRQRIDGVLFDSFDVPKSVQEEVLTRIKVLGRMNIAEKRLPQDGRATVQLGDRIVDLRIASLPTSHNERIVIRLLDKSARLYTLGELGMPDDALTRFRKLINRDHGLILVTGPTGSGKSTTLYAALQEINTTTQNVLTLEDPIEYQLDGISQTQINEKKGMTFASGLRSVLRQDPDIIMVGEIRDQETAMMAIQASLTGHLVFSTLHTNDAASAVTRLLDLEIEPYLVASSLVGSLAQRLVRQICSNCKTVVSAGQTADVFAQLPTELQGIDLFRGSGCSECRNSGYKGRIGVFELLIMNDRCRETVQNRGNASEIREAAIAEGMSLLERNGLDKVRAGLTTISEVRRVATLSGEDVV